MIADEFDTDVIRDENDSLEASQYPTARTTTSIPPPPPPKGLGKNLPTPCNHFKYRCDDRPVPKPKEYNNPPSEHIAHATRSNHSIIDKRHFETTYLWVSFSSVYGQLIIILAVVLCVTEVVNIDVVLMQYQSFFFLYLYLGSSLIIVCIYVYIVLSRGHPGTKDGSHDPGDAEVASGFGTLRKAYIRRSRIPRTSFHLRVGALVFGLATLIYSGLEIAVHTTVEVPCVDEIAFVHPILQAIFTFLQMHFLFVNSQVVLESSGVVARLGFMHLVATNVAVWVRMVTLDGAIEEARLLHQPSNGSSTTKVPLQLGTLQGKQEAAALTSPGSHEAILITALQKGKVRALYNCLNQSSLGRMWMEAVPFLLPFILQFCLVAAAVYYIMWRNIVPKSCPVRMGEASGHSRQSHSGRDYKEAKDCQLTRKGIFLGLFVLGNSIVLLVIFFVMQAKTELTDRLIWISLGTTIGVLVIGSVLSIMGIAAVRKLTYVGIQPLHLDDLLGNGTCIFVYFVGLLAVVAGASNVRIEEGDTLGISATLLVYGLLVVIHAALQSTFLSEAVRRHCTTNEHFRVKPGRQILVALLCCNVSLWLLDSFLVPSKEAQQMQSNFYGPVLWGFLSRINLPIVALNRFHSAVMTFEIWKIIFTKKR